MAEELQEHLVASLDIEQAELAASHRAVVSYEGRLIARAHDSHMLLRINGSRTDYQSVVMADGNSVGSEWDTSGLYVGRNYWGLDCDFSFRYIIATGIGCKRTGFGISMFAHADDRIVGYTTYGVWNEASSAISKIELLVIGGGEAVGNLTIALE